MNANDIKWITSGNLEHDPFYFSIPEKLEKFGYCIDMSGFGEGKTDKAQLCIIDTANRKKEPNILVICPDSCLESWYLSLIKGLGLDFKFIPGSKDAVMFFSAESSNLMLMGEKVLAEGETSGFAQIKSSGLLWDLVIIDAAGSPDGMNHSLYAEKFGMKCDRLLIFAPYPAAYTAQPEELRGVVKALVSDRGKAASIDGYLFDENMMKFTMESPLVNCPRENKDIGSIKIIRYSFPEADVPVTLHIEEQSGSRYAGGGNVFEEYALPERSVYRKNSYTESDVDLLRNKDKKLAAFLEVISGIMSSEDRTAVVYFRSEATVNYIEKILSSLYYDKPGSIVYLSKSKFDPRLLKQWYETKTGKPIRVVLASDNLSENIGIYTPITHIINYELPDNPVELQQRYMRRSVSVPSETQPEFIIFLDDNGLFDRRVLGRALCGNLYKSFRLGIPSENVLFNIEGIEEILTDMIDNIKYVADYTGAVGSSFDIISKFRQDYNIPAERNITTAAKTHEYSQRKLLTLAKTLGIEDMINEKEIDRNAVRSRIAEKVRQIRGGYTYFDQDLSLKTVPSSVIQTQEFREFSGYLDGNPFNLGLKKAREELSAAVQGRNDFAYIKDAVNQIPDVMKSAVLYNIWIYWHKTLGIGGSYAEFIKAYNEGVI